MVMDCAKRVGVRVAMCEVFARGGAGGEELARQVLEVLAEGKSKFAPIYDAELPIKQKIHTIVTKVYGGDGADFTSKADKAIEYLEANGLGRTPICMAKTQ